MDSAKLQVEIQEAKISSVLFLVFFVCLFVFCLFAISRAAPAACGDSQGRGRIGAVAVAAGLHHSHSNLGSEPRLQPTPQLTAAPDP